MPTVNSYVREYRRWLRGLVWVPGPFNDSILNLAWVMEYRYSIPNDDNRAEDGLKLRERFELETSFELPNLGECRVLEFLVGVAIRLNNLTYDFENPDQVKKWFWTLIDNLELRDPDDRYLSGDSVEVITETLDALVHRLYEGDGTKGGLFPLVNPSRDQRDVEVWYQMMEWLHENGF